MADEAKEGYVPRSVLKRNKMLKTRLFAETKRRKAAEEYIEADARIWRASHGSETQNKLGDGDFDLRDFAEIQRAMP